MINITIRTWLAKTVEEFRKDLEIIKSRILSISASISSLPYHPTSYADAVKTSGRDDEAQGVCDTDQAYTWVSKPKPGSNVGIPSNSVKGFRSAVFFTEARVAYEARVYRRTKQPPSSASAHPLSSSSSSDIHSCVDRVA